MLAVVAHLPHAFSEPLLQASRSRKKRRYRMRKKRRYRIRSARQACWNAELHSVGPPPTLESNAEGDLADIDADHGNRGVGLIRHGVLLVFGTPPSFRRRRGGSTARPFQ